MARVAGSAETAVMTMMTDEEIKECERYLNVTWHDDGFTVEPKDDSPKALDAMKRVTIEFYQRVSVGHARRMSLEEDDDELD